MSKRILIIQGHPDSSEPHLCHAFAASYTAGALEANHQLREIRLADLVFPLLRSQWEHDPLPPSLKSSQEDIAWAEHIVFFFPLWMGDMPALLKGFLEQVARPGFGFGFSREEGGNPSGSLKGRSAREVVNMGMPAIVYRWYYRAHSVKSLERNILGFVGIAPVHETLIGQTDKIQQADVAKWQDKLKWLGFKAE